MYWNCHSEHVVNQSASWLIETWDVLKFPSSL